MTTHRTPTITARHARGLRITLTALAATMGLAGTAGAAPGQVLYTPPQGGAVAVPDVTTPALGPATPIPTPAPVVDVAPLPATPHAPTPTIPAVLVFTMPVNVAPPTPHADLARPVARPRTCASPRPRGGRTTLRTTQGKAHRVTARPAPAPKPR